MSQDGTRLHELHAAGQSPWLDNLRRGWLTDGELAAWVDRGIRGLTSNPSIFQKAISTGTDYDEQFGDLISGGTSVTDAYWDLVTSDIEGALALLRPVYDSSDGVDGYVSVEVAPDLARDSAGTEAPARALHHGHRRAEPLREDPRHRRGRRADPGDDRRGAQHQRHAHLQPRPLRRGDGGLPGRPRGRPRAT